MRIMPKQEVLRYVSERRQLFDAAGKQNPFACADWTLNLIDHVAASDWTFVVPEWEVGRESVMLLYACPSLNGSGRISRVQALTNYYASLYSPVITASIDRVASVKPLIDQLSDFRPRFASVGLAPMDRGSGDVHALRRCFAATGWYAKEYFCFGNWYLPCDDLSFRTYIEERPSQLYNTWARKTKKFESDRRCRLEIVADLPDVERAIDAYQRVYAESWKQPEPFPDFISAWARTCARRGWLRLGLAWRDDVPIAAQFWFVMHRRAYIFKLAYDERFAKLSSGTVLTAHLMKHVLDQDRVVEVDYLTGDDPYKQCWMTRRRERIGILACNLFTFEGLASAATEVAGSVGSSVLRRGARSLSHFSVAVAWMQSFAECLIVCGI